MPKRREFLDARKQRRLPSVHHPFLASQCAGFVVKNQDAAAFEPLWVWPHKRPPQNR